MIALLTRLSGFAAHLTFNVGLASLFALTCTGAFGLVYNLVAGAMRASPSRGRPIGYGFLAAILVAVLGNLEGFFESLYSLRLLPASFWRWLDIPEISQAFDPTVAPSLMPTRSWWWWRASRVINDLDPLGRPMPVAPIDEFPGFSFLLGDMHPHVLALPFVFLVLAIALAVLRVESDETAHRGGLRGWPYDWWILVPLCLGALGFLNTWDLPIYLLIFLAAYSLARWRSLGLVGWPLLRDVGLTGIVVTALSFLFYLPFYLGLQSQAGGVLPTAYVGTRFRQYAVMFGPFLAAITGLLVIGALRARKRLPARRLLASWLRWSALFLFGPLAMMLLLVGVMLLTPGGRQTLENLRRDPNVAAIVGADALPVLLGKLALVKLRYWVMPLLVAGMAGMGAALLKAFCSPLGVRQPSPSPDLAATRGDESSTSVSFALLCAVAGLLLTLSVEFLYLVDNFGVRMNTVFKFYFQGWVLMAVASAFAVYWLGRQRGRLRLAFLAAFWLLFAVGMVYPILGNISRAGGFAHAPVLDGTAYLAASQPGDAEAIAWLNENVPGAPLILEAPGTGGSSYVYEGRVAALTGLPTLLGWGGHESQWRGSYTVQAAREPDIQMIYNTPSREVSEELLSRYGVRYVYVGPLERSKYDPRGLEKFDQFLEPVYRNESVTIYRVP
jgi:YYY domain-containing protein